MLFGQWIARQIPKVVRLRRFSGVFDNNHVPEDGQVTKDAGLHLKIGDCRGTTDCMYSQTCLLRVP